MLSGLAESGVSQQGDIRGMLESVRRHLDMEVAYVSEFVGDASVYREVDAPGLEALIKPGDSRPLDEVYCRHILAGRIPELLPDAALHPLAAAMPITAAVPIGAHLSVPIRLTDGSSYGMFCCLSPRANVSLNPRDLQVMRVFADMAARRIGQDRERMREAERAGQEIDAVIAQGLFSLAYQPIHSFQPARIVGFEALCRFRPEPYRTPDRWFAQAAAAGRGVALELAVLRRVAEAFARLPEDMFVSVNVAPDTILSGALDGLLAGFPAHRLVLEVTEHAAVASYVQLRNTLADIRRAGTRLAIDDAGSGYSSLQHIIELRPDIIKLDMELTRAIDTDAGRRAMAAALAYFARETGASIVAEGIETLGEFSTLRGLGIAKGQGHFLGRPADLESAASLLEAHALVLPA